MTRTKNAPPDPDSHRVFRGGGWRNNGASWVLAAFRRTIEPAYRSSRVGFRTSLTGRQPR